MSDTSFVTRILILDDNPADLRRVERILDEIDGSAYEASSFTTIKDALTFLDDQQDQIDVCLVDYRLFGQTAFDFIAQLQTRDIRQLPIVIMTGFEDKEIDRKLMALGIQDYWDKNNISPNHLERSLRYARYRFEQQQDMLYSQEQGSRHVFQVCQDIKTPLSDIGGYLKIVENNWQNASDEDTKGRINDCFEKINRSYSHLKNLVENLTGYSEIDLDNLVLYRKPFKLAELFSELEQSYAPIAKNNENTLSIFYPTDIIAYADLNRIKQVVGNLLSNAIKFTHSGEITIRASSEKAQNTSQLVITVKDTGQGMAEEQIEYLQRPHYDEHNEHKVSHTYGLEIARHISELHGGQLAITSELGKGTEVSISIPQRSNPNYG
ncbi:sensor histidine kinase [Aurantivibrio plasticivorans]